MKLEKNNIVLTRLSKNDLELVRKWRNDTKISQYMFFQDYITQEMQLKWFESINNDRNFYFIIKINDKKIGLTEIKNINYENMNAEAGIFIYDDEFLNGITSYQVIFILMDFAFEELKINQFNILVRDDNKRAIRFNKSLGYIKDESQGKNNYTLSKKDYEISKNRLSKILKLN